MKIYVVRHGETDWNAQNKVCGSTDRPLNEQGVRQARQLAEKVRELPVDAIISSPMERAKMTAGILAQALGLPVEYDARLVEQDYGRMEGVSRADADFLAAKGNMSLKMPGGESLLQVAQRVYNALDDIKARHAGQNVLIVCHGCVMRVVHSYFESLTQQEYMSFITPNCGVREYEWA